METVNQIDPVLAKVIGYAVLLWLAGYGSGKVYHFVAEIFKKGSRSH